MEEAVSQPEFVVSHPEFVEGLESQELSGFDNIHRLLQGLPVPVTKAIRLMTHAEAIEAQFLPNMVGMSVEKTFERKVAKSEASKERALRTVGVARPTKPDSK
jgi:hypothetical protein